MDANIIFNHLLNQIEKSQLNFSITKTPFSATISLKSSFIKRFNSSVINQEEVKQKASVDDVDDNIINDLKSENKKMKTELKNLEETVTNQKLALDEQFKRVKDALKATEDQKGVFRAELLKVKNERNKLGAQLKSLEDENEQLMIEAKVLKKENIDIKKAAANNKKKHEQEVKDLEKEKEIIGTNVCQLTSKVEALEQQVKDFNWKKFECPLCDHKAENLGKIKNHVRTNHTKDVYSQVGEFNEDEANKPQFAIYPCFYCGKRITSILDLKEHIPVCITIQDFTPYQCDVCGAQCADECELGRHRTKYHYLETFSAEFESEFFYCDICPLNYRTIAELKLHRIECHCNEE